MPDPPGKPTGFTPTSFLEALAETCQQLIVPIAEPGTDDDRWLHVTPTGPDTAGFAVVDGKTILAAFRVVVTQVAVPETAAPEAPDGAVHALCSNVPLFPHPAHEWPSGDGARWCAGKPDGTR